jgi:hypothetical protein
MVARMVFDVYLHIRFFSRAAVIIAAGFGVNSFPARAQQYQICRQLNTAQCAVIPADGFRCSDPPWVRIAGPYPDRFAACRAITNGTDPDLTTVCVSRPIFGPQGGNGCAGRRSK